MIQEWRGTFYSRDNFPSIPLSHVHHLPRGTLLSSESDREELELEVFDRMDLDSSGYVDAEEISGAIDAFLIHSPGDVLHDELKELAQADGTAP